MMDRDLLEAVVVLARRAGEAVLQIYATDFKVDVKHDASPVTAADALAEERILHGLAIVAPGVPVVSEEATASHRLPPTGERFWLVDPLDGTKEFVSRNGEFTVNIALIEQGEPILGVVAAPALGKIYAGASGAGAFLEERGARRKIACRHPPADGLTVVSSRSHGDRQALEAFLADRHVATSVFAGSSLKFCLIAAGQADLYPRLGRTMEWDTAAGHAVLDAAGGHVTLLAGAPLSYGKQQFENPHFVASGRMPSQAG